MSIALKELWRQPQRFLPVWVALTLLVVLLVILAGFLDGLSRSQTGPYRAYDGDVFVLSDDANLQVQRSRVSADALTDQGLDDVADVGFLDAAFTVAAVEGTATGNTSSDNSDDGTNLQDVALYGYSMSSSVLPHAPDAGEVVVDKQLTRQIDVEVGDRLVLGPSAEPMTVAAIVDDLSAGAPTLWVNGDEWRRLVGTINPALLPPSGQHLALIAQPGADIKASTVVEQVDQIDGLEAADVADMIGALSVVQQQNATFTAIIGVTFVVSLLVVALFFALITLEQTRLYAVFKALGATTRELLTGISVQAVVLTLIALAVGMAISAVLVAALPPTLPVRVLPTRLLEVAVGLLVTSVIGGLLTARRLLRIDPASSIG